MTRYTCSVNLKKVIEADSAEQAAEKFMEWYDMDDLYPECKIIKKRAKK